MLQESLLVFVSHTQLELDQINENDLLQLYMDQLLGYYAFLRWWPLIAGYIKISLNNYLNSESILVAIYKNPAEFVQNPLL